MATRDARPAPADFLALALSPILIMALVGSLLFFLVEVFCFGEAVGRMQYVFFFFIAGAVLVARIALQPDLAPRAWLYTAVLGVVAWFSIQSAIAYPPHLAPYGGLVSAGMVLLIFWCSHRLTADCTFMDEGDGASGEGVLQAAGLGEASPSIARYKEQQAQNEGKKRTPGVWVVYFSLAALPLFGLGQAFIPVEEAERRRFTFWLMLLYTGSGLGLLLTTSFLGLRLYLRRRSLKMPAAMTVGWLVLGGGILAALLVGGALLPRPSSELKVVELNFVLTASDSADSQRRRPGQGDQEKDKEDEAKDQRKDEKGEKDGKDGKDRPASQGGGKEGEGQRQSSRQKPGAAPTASWLDDLLPILRWIVLGLIGLIVLFLVLRGVLHYAAGFSAWARQLLDMLQRWWASLFGWFHTSEKEGNAKAVPSAPPRPFAVFSNPFADGRAGRMPLAELIRYSFAALEAWARDRKLGRPASETPLEMAGRLGEEVPPLEREALLLANLFALASYGADGVPSSSRDGVERFWETLERTTAQPLSA